CRRLIHKPCVTAITITAITAAASSASLDIPTFDGAIRSRKSESSALTRRIRQTLRIRDVSRAATGLPVRWLRKSSMDADPDAAKAGEMIQAMMTKPPEKPIIQDSPSYPLANKAPAMATQVA